MRKIKFRGRCIGNGTFVYGHLMHNFDDVYVNYWQVDPESVAQLVGIDANGNEVYEGDKILIDDAGEDEFFATCLPVGVNHWGGCFLHGGNFIFTKEFSLKEACQNPWNALQEIDNLIERHVEEAKQ